MPGASQPVAGDVRGVWESFLEGFTNGTKEGSDSQRSQVPGGSEDLGLSQPGNRSRGASEPPFPAFFHPLKPRRDEVNNSQAVPEGTQSVGVLSSSVSDQGPGRREALNRKEERHGRLRLSAELDSEEPFVVAKATASLFQGLAKAKATLFAPRSADGPFRAPVLSAAVGKALSVSHDLETSSTLCACSLDVGDLGTVSLEHDTGEQCSTVSAVVKPSAVLAVPLKRLSGRRRDRLPPGVESQRAEGALGALWRNAFAELQYQGVWRGRGGTLPSSLALTRAALFLPPFGEISFQPRPKAGEEEEGEEGQAPEGHPQRSSPTPWDCSGLFRAHLGKGSWGPQADKGTLLTVGFDSHPQLLSLGLRKKAGKITVGPQLSVPLPLTLTHIPAMDWTFKMRFNEANKLSLLYNVEGSDFSAVYKCTPKFGFLGAPSEEDPAETGQPLKLKLGFDSARRLLWSSLWVGNEEGGASQAPWQTKAQLMVQIPQGQNGPGLDLREAAIMLRLKKRLDLF